MSSDSPASILFNIDGYAVGALFDGDFIPFDNVGLLVGGKDADGYFRYLSTSSGGTIKVTPSTGRQNQAKYFASTSQIVGSAVAQNLLTIENPSGSNVDIFINRIFVNGVLGSNSAVVFLYRINRTSALPTGGTTLTETNRNTADVSATAVVRQAPTATAAGGTLWSNAPGVSFIPVGVSNTNNIETFNPRDEDAEIALLPGEALLVSAQANSTSWTHWVNIYWSEADSD